jgi:hypothetical protein
MDIEGAEYDALLGAKRLIENVRPHLILEQNPQDSKCFELLASIGYLAIDCNDYRRIQTINEFKSGTPIMNVMFIHKSRLSETPYKLPILKESVRELTKNDFKANSASGYDSCDLPLRSGRYSFKMNFIASGVNNNLFTGVRRCDEGKIIFRYNANSSFLAQAYRDWLVDVPADGEYQIYFEFCDTTRDESLMIRGADIYRFPNLTTPLWSGLVLD